MLVLIFVSVKDVGTKDRVENDHEESEWNHEEDEAQNWISAPHVTNHATSLE
jgi:hypothetical protein